MDRETKPTRNHGGKRPGAGRPKLTEEPTHTLSLTIPKAWLGPMERIGEGSVQAGIRLCIEDSGFI